MSKNGRGIEQRAFFPEMGTDAAPVGRKIMIARIAAMVAILASFAVLGMQSAAAAPAATSAGAIQFSTSVDSNARPESPRTEFGGGTNTVWASFEYRDHDPNADVTALVRTNGDDYREYDLACCKSSSGRFAFPITKRGGGGDLPGAAYDVRVYVNGAEVAQGGFGVNGRGGLDNDGQDYDNDND